MVRVIPMHHLGCGHNFVRAYYCQPCFQIIVENAKDVLPALQLEEATDDQAYTFIGSMLGMSGPRSSPIAEARAIRIMDDLDIVVPITEGLLDEPLQQELPLQKWHPTAKQLREIREQGLKEGMIDVG